MIKDERQDLDSLSVKELIKFAENQLKQAAEFIKNMRDKYEKESEEVKSSHDK